ncbi:MAG: hypothetical protein LC800_15745 [Acidobacteria bacterium]|nr:hypothetical protein [Acidobacteriota bacterium]
MPEAFFNSLERFATWQVVALLFILFILCAQGFEWRRKTFGYENTALDARRWYSPDEARDFLGAIGGRGRRIYIATELTLDILFPLVYGALFAALIIHVYARGNARSLVLAPLLTALADVLENISAAYLAWRFDGQASPVARVAATFTAVKSGLFVLSLILILVGALAAIWRTSRSPA